MPTPTDKQELIERIAKHLPEELWNDLSYSDLLFHIATAWLEDREKTVSKHVAVIKGIRDGISGHNFPETVAAIDGILADLTKPKEGK